jgi:hypothetical protein
MSEPRNGATWARWGLGIAASALGVLIVSIMAWIVHRVDRIDTAMDARAPIIAATEARSIQSADGIENIEESQDEMLEAISSLRTEMALLSQEIRLTRLSKELRDR